MILGTKDNKKDKCGGKRKAKLTLGWFTKKKEAKVQKRLKSERKCLSVKEVFKGIRVRTLS